MRQAVKSKVVEVVCSQRVGRALQGVTRGHVRARQATFDVSQWEPHLASAVAFRLYERSEARFCVKYLAGSERVLELGGSRGVVASTLLHRLPETAHLVSVEANPSLVPELRRNLARNKGRRTAEGRHLAIGDGEKLLFDTSRGSLGSALSSTAGETVPMTTLDDLVDELGWEDFVLMSDIEGAEAGFVLGESRALGRCTAMVIELHNTRMGGDQVTVADMIEALRHHHGFTKVDQHKDVAVFVR